MTTLQGAVFVGALPGSGPWTVCCFRGLIVLTSPMHPPLVVKDGRLEPLEVGSELGSPLPK